MPLQFGEGLDETFRFHLDSSLSLLLAFASRGSNPPISLINFGEGLDETFRFHLDSSPSLLLAFASRGSNPPISLINFGEGGIRTPGTGFSPYTRLAIEHLRPLGHLSNFGERVDESYGFIWIHPVSLLAFASIRFESLKPLSNLKLRRERDSNPRTPFSVSGFQDQRLQPLGHLSVSKTTTASIPP